MRHRSTRVEINPSALLHNLKLLRRWAGEKNFLCPMVKAHAYGHDDLLVARLIESSNLASVLGVALIEEGVRLRQAGLRMPILVFAPFDRDGAQALQEYGLTPVVGRFEDLEALRPLSSPPAFHLKFNTGMQRLGFDESDLSELRNKLAKGTFNVTGVCTHLTHGEEILQSDGFTQRQIEKFLKLSASFPGVRHLHKSSTLSTLQDGDQFKDFGARPGISLYGLPHDGRAVGPGLKPVLSWHSQLERVHQVPAGESVGYSARWTAARNSWIGMVPVGYADGYMRVLSNRSFMLWRGKRVPVVGSVCMDYILLDLTEAVGSEPARVGEPIVLIGQQGQEEIGAVDLAEMAGTIAYEVVTSISQRVPREVV